VQADLQRAGFAPRRERVDAETVDGEQTLETVIGERVGRESRRVVIVAQRDAPADEDGAAGDGAAARLSGTAALLELARLYRGRATRRTLTLVSTSGATGGSAGVRDVVDRLRGPVDAVIVLGDLAGRTVRRPFVIPWSESAGSRRCACAHGRGGGPAGDRPRPRVAARAGPARPPGRPAVAHTAGRAGAAGLSAVTLQASGERGPDPGTDVSRAQLQAFGRATLRSITALDNGPDVPSGPREYVIAQRQVVPRWTVALLGGALLLPLLLAAVDGLARVRRRRGPVVVWLRWLVAGALPFVLAALVVRVLGLAGAVPPLAGAVDPAALTPDGAVLAVAVLVLVVGLLLRGPLARALGARSAPDPATSRARRRRSPSSSRWSPSRSGSSTPTPRCCSSPPPTCGCWPRCPRCARRGRWSCSWSWPGSCRSCWSACTTPGSSGWGPST
jgi:hypothetical protein